MKRSKFTEEQIIAILREQVRHEPATGSRAMPNAANTAEVCRRHGSEAEKQMIQ